MILYLAGGVSGNLKPLFHSTGQSLDKGNGIKKALVDGMHIFLAGLGGRYWIPDEIKKGEESGTF